MKNVRNNQHSLKKKSSLDGFNTPENGGLEPVPLTQSLTKGMFTLYRIGFCSVSKVAPVQCEQELMFCCGAEIVPKRSQCEQEP